MHDARLLQRLSKIQRQLASLIEHSAYCYVNDDKVVLVFINPKGDRKELEIRRSHLA